MSSKSVGFYTSRPIWSGDPLNLDDPSIIRNFKEEMSRIEFSYEQEKFSLKAFKDGMIVLKIFELEERAPRFEAPTTSTDMCMWWNEYLIFINCLNLLLNSAVEDVMNYLYLDLSEITNKDAFRVDIEENERLIHPMPLSYAYLFLKIPNLPNFMKAFLSETCEDIQINEKEFYKIISQNFSGFLPDVFNSRLSIPKKVFDLVVRDFASVVDKDSLAPMIAGIAKSVSEYKVANYDLSLILSWFVIESLLTRKWEIFLENKNKIYGDGSKRINEEREKLFDGRDYTISVISNILELSDMIPFETFNRIDVVRKYRNKVVHQDQVNKFTSKHCDMAIRLALDLLYAELPIRILPPQCYYVPTP